MTTIDLKVNHYFAAGVYAREMQLQKGHYADSHKHKFSHLSILASGIALVEVEGIEKIFYAPAVIEIKAGLIHKITALEDVFWYCIHASEETDVSKIDKVLII